MDNGFDEILLDKPFEEATFLDFCKCTRRQRSLKEMKEASLEELKARIGDDELAETTYKAVQDCREG